MAKVVLYEKRIEDQVGKAPGLKALFDVMGAEWVARLNTELNAAEAKRGQPVEEGYKHYVNTLKHEVRLYVVAFTARAQAHEARHSAMLKQMRTAGHTIVRGKATNPRQD